MYLYQTGYELFAARSVVIHEWISAVTSKSESALIIEPSKIKQSGKFNMSMAVHWPFGKLATRAIQKSILNYCASLTLQETCGSQCQTDWDKNELDKLLYLYIFRNSRAVMGTLNDSWGVQEFKNPFTCMVAEVQLYHLTIFREWKSYDKLLPNIF